MAALAACAPRQDKLETALRLAGDNRPELEKVLDHYSQSPADSLKLRAARFLIENMPGHYTITGKSIEAMRAKIDSDTTAPYLLKKTLDIAIGHLNEMTYGARRQEDVRCIKADFLIHHIDRSFEKRESYPWARELPFDFFLEYVLPYRFENERLDSWIDSIQISPAVWDEVINSDDKRYTLWNSNPLLSNLTADFSLEHPMIMDILHCSLRNECRDLSALITLYRRAIGTPMAVDYIPHYANRNGYHYWHNKLSPEFKDSKVTDNFERRSAKVFRRTFSIQPHADSPQGEYVPEPFLDPFVKDVTGDYYHTADIRIPSIVTPRKVPHYAYLFTFCNLTWTPSAIGEYAPDNTSFTNMSKNILYLPGYYHTRAVKAMNYPFVLRLDGGIDYLQPDTTKRLRARLERKYPFSQTLLLYNQGLAFTSIKASNNLPRKHVVPLNAKIISQKTYSEIMVDSTCNYRYWQIVLPRGISCAEIIFLDTEGKQMRGEVEEKFKNLHDEDPLTCKPTDYVDTAFVTFDFGIPVAVSRVILLPRSDGNGIYPGDEYELFYHDFDGWRSLGRRTATDYFLDYDNLPAGALYWLHNHTRGVEERPFTITDSGDIRFW